MPKDKGEDPKELKEWTFKEKMENLFAPSLRWYVEPYYGDGLVAEEDMLGVDLVDKKLPMEFCIRILEYNVQHIHVDPHLSYILLKDSTVITFLPDKDVLVIS